MKVQQATLFKTLAETYADVCIVADESAADAAVQDAQPDAPEEE